MPSPQKRPYHRSLWEKIAGPGLITGASDDDPSGIATYSQAGARFGLSTLWTAVVTYPLMVAIQEMCARIGLITGHGLTGVLKRNYPKTVLWLIVLVSFPAITLNIAADLAGMGAVLNLLIPQVPDHLFSAVIGVAILYFVIRWPYRRIADVLRWFCLSLLCYLVVPFLYRQDWGQILRHTLLPEIRLTAEFMAVIVGILGTTISPYLFFWQASMEVEEVKSRHLVIDKRIIGEMRREVGSGIFFSNLVFYFIILATGTVLFREGIHEINTVEDAARALRPLAGELSYLLFSVGVLGTGMLAVPVLAGSLSYMISEALDWDEGLDKKFHEAKGFYLVMIISVLIAVCINLLDISPVKTLLLTAIVYGLTAPLLIGMILHISNRRDIMNGNVNSLLQNILGGLAFLLMTAAAAALLFFTLYT
jgi:NRAMP (natural resistance-associated macrophage protein)-like metal ion transporter